HEQPVLSAAFSTDGKYIVTTGEDNRAIIWDWEKVKTPLVAAATAGERSAVFSSSGDNFIVTGSDGTLARFEKRAGHWELVSRKTLGEQEKTIAVSQNSERMITRGRNGLNLWDTRTGLQVISFKARKGESAEFSQNSRYIVGSTTLDNGDTQPIPRMALWV